MLDVDALRWEAGIHDDLVRVRDGRSVGWGEVRDGRKWVLFAILNETVPRFGVDHEREPVVRLQVLQADRDEAR